MYALSVLQDYCLLQGLFTLSQSTFPALSPWIAHAQNVLQKDWNTLCFQVIFLNDLKYYFHHRVFFFPFSPGVLFKFYFRIKFYHAKFYFLPDRVLSLSQQDIISSPSNPDIPLLEPLFDSALYYNHSHIEFFSLVTIKP